MPTLIGERTVPEKLYKYHKFDDEMHYKGLLGKNELYCASPKLFNDPFDCKISPAFELGSDDDIYKKFLYHVISENPSLPAQAQNRIAWKVFKENIEILRSPELLRKRTEWQIDNLFGICSFSEKNDNLLMWSHYTDSHKGFCVEFDFNMLHSIAMNYIKIDQLVNLEKVDYSNEYPILNPYLSIDDTKNYLNGLLTKSEVWEYEEEWRIIYSDNPNESIELPDKVITGVYFGVKCGNDEIDIAKKLFKGKSSKPIFYKAKLKNREFGLEFEKIKY